MQREDSLQPFRVFTSNLVSSRRLSDNHEAYPSPTRGRWFTYETIFWRVGSSREIRLAELDTL